MNRDRIRRGCCNPRPWEPICVNCPLRARLAAPADLIREAATR